MEKVCFKCKEEKLLSEFYPHPQMADGHLNKCKTCTKKDVRENRRVSERAREYDRRRYKENQERRKDTNRRAREYRLAHPERKRATTAVGNAIKAGLIIKPDACSRCGEKSRRIHGHHEDYSKPLEVIWLCPPCHAIVENKTK